MVTIGVPKLGALGTLVRLEITAVAGKGYFGSVFLNYRRNDIETFIGTKPKVFLNGTATHVADLIGEINADYQMNLQPEDYYNDILPVFAESSTLQFLPFNLRIKPGSLFFLGTVELSLQRKAVALSQYILNTTLEDDIY